MAGPLYADRVKETTTTTGTGTISLGGAASGARTFVSGIGSTNTCYYCISHQSADEWEVGIGTVTSGSPDTLSRTTVLSSSNSGSLVSFSSGTKDVFCVAPAVYGLPVIQMSSTFALRRVNESSLSSTVGNARGTGAVDLQCIRNASNQVAAGDSSVICGGERNRASGLATVVVGGIDNIASATRATIVGGRNNQATQVHSFIGGGYDNQATGAYAAVCGGSRGRAANNNVFIGGGDLNRAYEYNSTICGGIANRIYAPLGSILGGKWGKVRLRGQMAFGGSGGFASIGDCQTSLTLLRNTTTNGTATELFVNGSSERMTLPNNTVWAFEIFVAAVRTGAADESAAYKFEGCIDRQGTASSTALVGSVAKTVIAEDNAAWDCDVDADTTNGSLRITVTGEASKTIRWIARVMTTEVSR